MTGVIWRTTTRIMTWVRDLVQRIRDDQAQVEYSVTGWSRGRITSCVICTVHKKTRSASFFDLTSKPRSLGFSVWTSKLTAPICWFRHQIIATISWFEPQNQAGYSLLVAPQNRREEDGARYTSRSNGLLRLKASRTRVSQFISKLVNAW
jgi:hypothetical protein